MRRNNHRDGLIRLSHLNRWQYRIANIAISAFFIALNIAIGASILSMMGQH